MLTFLPPTPRFFVALAFMSTYTLILGGMGLFLALGRFVSPLHSTFNHWMLLGMEEVARWWNGANYWLVQQVNDTSGWEWRGTEHLKKNDWVMLISNHRSWNDVIILMGYMLQRVPMVRYFLKQELIWLPVVGLYVWAMDFMFMKRYTKEQIAKDPSLAGKDLETARRQCAKFKKHPVSIMVFPEGTRFTPAKHDFQKSPYVNLLKPRAGGFAFAVQSMDGLMKHALDITLIYENMDRMSFKDLLSGRMGNLVVDIRPVDIPEPFHNGDYREDTENREAIQAWLSSLWQAKDQRIMDVRQEKGWA
jgi:1-acyl-sn-glycerol-3-phosphate acyltransferase